MNRRTMKARTWKAIRLVPLCFLAVLTLTASGATPAASGHKVLLGIMPVYDISGELFGDDFARNLTYIVFRDLQSNDAVEPVLLNPGGVYDPKADDWVMDYGHNANVDAVLVMQLDSDRQRRGNTTLTLTSEVREL